jgi:hypothetical protein
MEPRVTPRNAIATRSQRAAERDRWEARIALLDERREFWLRRSIAVVGLANTAAVVALGSAVLNADDKPAMAQLVIEPIRWFSAGMLLNGFALIIIGSYVAFRAKSIRLRYEPSEKEKYVRVNTVVLLYASSITDLLASGAFSMGVATAIGVVAGLAHG